MQVIGDAESSDESDGVHGYKRRGAERGDCYVDDENNAKAKGQLTGDGRENEEVDGVPGCNRRVAEPGDSGDDDERSENVSDGQMDDGESSGESDGVHFSERRRADPEDSGDDDESCPNPSDWQYDYAGDGISNKNKCSEVDTDSARNTTKMTDEKNFAETKREVFFFGQKFFGLEELETAKKIYEDSHFCELWKRLRREDTDCSSKACTKEGL